MNLMILPGSKVLIEVEWELLVYAAILLVLIAVARFLAATAVAAGCYFLGERAAPAVAAARIAKLESRQAIGRTIKDQIILDQRKVMLKQQETIAAARMAGAFLERLVHDD